MVVDEENPNQSPNEADPDPISIDGIRRLKISTKSKLSRIIAIAGGLGSPGNGEEWKEELEVVVLSSG